METELEALIREFTGLRVWAVVGASTNPAKYGHRIFRDLRAAGYRVYGVNPGGGEIDGEALYPSLAALPEKPQVVDLVVPPQVTEQVVQECAALGLTRVWMQPGSESEAAIRYCQEHGIRVVHDACAMVRKRVWED
ncbi:MAG: CoA-binding protein [Chloroflexi bacterium]|nr:CoA-binding protein [Chloroflexota bacterium]